MKFGTTFATVNPKHLKTLFTMLQPTTCKMDVQSIHELSNYCLDRYVNTPLLGSHNLEWLVAKTYQVKAQRDSLEFQYNDLKSRKGHDTKVLRAIKSDLKKAKTNLTNLEKIHGYLGQILAKIKKAKETDFMAYPSIKLDLDFMSNLQGKLEQGMEAQETENAFAVGYNLYGRKMLKTYKIHYATTAYILDRLFWINHLLFDLPL